MLKLLHDVRDTPWRATNETRRLLMLPYYRLMFGLYGVRWGIDWRIYGMPLIQRFAHSEIAFGRGLNLRSWRGSNPLAPIHPVILATRTPKAIIRVGDHFGMTGGKLIAAERIEIGNRVVIGANVTIMDTDFHWLDPAERRRDMLNGLHSPVIIEDDVFVGLNSLILKGVRLGAGSVIGAGSIVTRDVPPGMIAAGNPAKLVRAVKQQTS